MADRICPRRRISQDNDCDGVSDEGLDNDGDGTGRCRDCDDHDPAVFPGPIEACDGQDEDCDGIVDDGFDVDPARPRQADGRARRAE
ncbi:MAG: putative metal-binding motif-containing protein, partial [Myxococcota bacterium]